MIRNEECARTDTVSTFLSSHCVSPLSLTTIPRFYISVEKLSGVNADWLSSSSAGIRDWFATNAIYPSSRHSRGNLLGAVGGHADRQIEFGIVR